MIGLGATGILFVMGIILLLVITFFLVQPRHKLFILLTIVFVFSLGCIENFLVSPGVVSIPASILIFWAMWLIGILCFMFSLYRLIQSVYRLIKGGRND
jgi:hypothetical protein